VLECTDWDADNYPEEYERDYEYSEGLLQFDREDAGLDKEMADMDTEFKNLKDALLSGSTAKDENDEYGDGDSPEQLEEFERMMTEIMAIKGEQYLLFLEIQLMDRQTQEQQCRRMRGGISLKRRCVI
jgi:hypothetical protein